jgi:hypothetical protein
LTLVEGTRLVSRCFSSLQIVMRKVKAPTQPEQEAGSDDETLRGLVTILKTARVRQRHQRASEEQTTAGFSQEAGQPVDEVPIEGAALADDLGELFAAMGIASDASEDAKLWREFSAETSNHKTLAAGFQKMSRAKDPLSRDLCIGEYRAALQRKLTLHWSSKARRDGRNAPPSLDLLEWDRLSREERSHIRVMCGEPRGVSTWLRSTGTTDQEHAQHGAPSTC